MQAQERNEINNRRLKEALADAALSTLREGEDYDTLAGLSLEYGYLFEIDDHGLEALFKIVTDRGSFYFAAQKQSILRLDFSEDLFRSTTESFLTRHGQEQSTNNEALDRKARSIEILKKQGIPYTDGLPVIESAGEARIRSAEEIAERAVCCLVTIQHAFDVINNNDVEGSRDWAQGMLKNWGLADKLTDNEQQVFDRTLESGKLSAFPWKYEAYWVLVWALGYVDTLGMPVNVCDCDKAIKIVSDKKSFDAFLSGAKPRNADEILDEADLIFRIHWAVVEARIHGQEPPAQLDSSVVLERHMALNWLIGYDDDWDNVSVST
jgi:hypothetical protein